MFVRTRRLSLRPGWIEDAPALARAIGHAAVARNLARVPFPYDLADAEAFLTMPRPVDEPDFLIFEHVGNAVELVGGIGAARRHDAHELGYWLTPHAWGRGIATEAGRGVIATLRDSLHVARLTSGHFVDNPASGRVLAKLGFASTGMSEERFSVARGRAVECRLFALDLAQPAARMAA